MHFFPDSAGMAMLVGFLFLALSVGAALWKHHWPDRWSLAASAAWFGYWMWESQIVEVGDNIRVDLLLIYPALATLSLLGAATALGPSS